MKRIILVFRTPATRGATASFRRRFPAHVDGGRIDREKTNIIRNAGFSDSADGWISFADGAAQAVVAAFEDAGYEVVVEGAFPEHRSKPFAA